MCLSIIEKLNKTTKDITNYSITLTEAQMKEIFGEDFKNMILFYDSDEKNPIIFEDNETFYYGFSYLIYNQENPDSYNYGLVRFADSLNGKIDFYHELSDEMLARIKKEANFHAEQLKLCQKVLTHKNYRIKSVFD
jgi:hypothetical protein